MPLPSDDAVRGSAGNVATMGTLSQNNVRPVGYVQSPESRSVASAADGALTAREQAALEEIRRRQAAGYEVICIVRPKNDPHAESDVIVLENVSQAFVNQLVAGRPATQPAAETPSASENRVADRRGFGTTSGGNNPVPKSPNGLPPIPAAILPVAP
ncbi:MAG: hypothetical protein D6741_10255 [Planctomycetota bacterium]|nr:MAG: hypothetical protein D6741_10255 [Planctomycetota bacterium]